MITLNELTAQTHQNDLMRRGAFRPVRGTGRPSLRARVLSRSRRPAEQPRDRAGAARRTVTA